MAEKKKQIKGTRKETRVKKNQKKYGQKVVVKSYQIHKGIIILLIISLLINCFTVYHFITFNHHKVKTVTKEIIKTDDNYLFLGDSITYQYDLEKYFGKDLPLVNSGIDGNTIEDILDNMKERVYRYNPTKVFLLIGTNDVPHKDKEEIISNIQKIIENIRKERSNCKIYLESIYPINNTNDEKISHGMVSDRKNEDIKKINEELEAYAKKTKNVTYIDVYDKLVDEDGNLKIDYTREGLHLTQQGYETVTEVLKEYIEK